MPWDIDYALLTFEKLKKSSYYLNSEDTIYIDTALNLSSYIVNWEESKLPKEFFIEKYKTISKLLDWAKHKPFIYEGDELYGHLDLQKSSTNSKKFIAAQTQISPSYLLASDGCVISDR